MISLGLTGSIGMGKSTTADMFRAAGIPVYDADAAVHDLYSGRAAPLVEAEFPGTTRNGIVDRAALGAVVLNNQDALKKLEAIIHPLVHAKEQEFLAQAKAAGFDLVVLDIPLLFETGGTSRVDKILVVTASPDIQRNRVLARDGMNDEKLQAILARQVPDADKRKQADFLIDTGLGMEAAKTRVKEIISELRTNSVE